MNCVKCGNPLEENAVFCKKCGQPVGAPVINQVVNQSPVEQASVTTPVETVNEPQVKVIDTEVKPEVVVVKTVTQPEVVKVVASEPASTVVHEAAVKTVQVSTPVPHIQPVVETPASVNEPQVVNQPAQQPASTPANVNTASQSNVNTKINNGFLIIIVILLVIAVALVVILLFGDKISFSSTNTTSKQITTRNTNVVNEEEFIEEPVEEEFVEENNMNILDRANDTINYQFTLDENNNIIALVIDGNNAEFFGITEDDYYLFVNTVLISTNNADGTKNLVLYDRTGNIIFNYSILPDNLLYNSFRVEENVIYITANLNLESYSCDDLKNLINSPKQETYTIEIEDNTIKTDLALASTDELITEEEVNSMPVCNN